MCPADLGINVQDAVKHDEGIGDGGAPVNAVALLYVTEDGKEAVVWKRMLAGTKLVREVQNVHVKWRGK